MTKNTRRILEEWDFHIQYDNLYPINSKIPDTLREYSKKLEEITRILEELLPATRRINSSTFFECFSFVVEDMLMENMQRLNGLGRSSELDDIDKQERYDCGVDGCIKTFFHEHVGVKNEAQDGVLVSESQIVSSTEPNDS